MADDRSETEKELPGGKTSSPTPMPEKEKADAKAIGKALQGLISDVADSAAGYKAPSHTPTIPQENDASGGNARGRSLSEKPLTFAERLEGLRQMVRDIGSPDQCHDDPEPECR